MHGGAGALISIGLLRAVSYDHMHRCVQGAYSSGGDAFITECLWEVQVSYNACAALKQQLLSLLRCPCRERPLADIR